MSPLLMNKNLCRVLVEVGNTTLMMISDFYSVTIKQNLLPKLSNFDQNPDCPIFIILSNFHNFFQFSESCPIFRISSNFHNFVQFDKFCPIFPFCPIFRILSNFQFYPIFQFCPNFQNFVQFSILSSFINFVQFVQFGLNCLNV